MQSRAARHSGDPMPPGGMRSHGNAPAPCVASGLFRDDLSGKDMHDRAACAGRGKANLSLRGALPEGRTLPRAMCATKQSRPSQREEIASRRTLAMTAGAHRTLGAKNATQARLFRNTRKAEQEALSGAPPLDRTSRKRDRSLHGFREVAVPRQTGGRYGILAMTRDYGRPCVWLIGSAKNAQTKLTPRKISRLMRMPSTSIALRPSPSVCARLGSMAKTAMST